MARKKDLWRPFVRQNTKATNLVQRGKSKRGDDPSKKQLNGGETTGIKGVRQRRIGLIHHRKLLVMVEEKNKEG